MSLVKITAALSIQLQSLAPIIPAVNIASVTATNPAVFTTSTPHGLKSGILAIISNYSGSTPAIDGSYFLTVLSSTTFTLQNTATKSAIAVIIAGSGGSILANLIAWPNVSWQGILGIPYQQVDLLTARPEEPTQGGGYRRELGVFQVTLIYPLGIGTGAITARAELIKAGFAKGLSLVNNGVTVVIPSTPEIVPPYTTGDSYYMPVKIYYRADIYS
jgi:hypothetical protein